MTGVVERGRASVDVVTGRVDTKGAATIIGVTPATLAKWRTNDEGPPYFKLGRILYRAADIEEWMNLHYVRPGR